MPNRSLSRLAQYITPRWLKPALAGLAGLAASCAFAATITVNSTADTAANDGVCTLREAITAANTDTASGAMAGECAAGSGTDTIAFNIAGAGVKTIAPLTALPIITTNVQINGYTQPGTSVNTNGPTVGSNAVILIEIDSAAIVNAPAIYFSGAGASGSIIEGLAIGRSANPVCCFDNGIYALGVSNLHIRGNFIGTNASGLIGRFFGANSVVIENGTDATVGSTQAALTPAYQNLISSASNNLVALVGNPHSNLSIRGNLIGTNATGLAALSGTVGINLDGVSGNSVISNNVIGG